MSTITTPTPGETLPNGATVVAARATRTSDVVAILAIYNTEFVTWVARADDLRTTSHGHYTHDLREAVEDYFARF